MEIIYAIGAYGEKVASGRSLLMCTLPKRCGNLEDIHEWDKRIKVASEEIKDYEGREE